MGKPIALKVANETKPGRYTDGQGLHLDVRGNGRMVATVSAAPVVAGSMAAALTAPLRPVAGPEATG